MKSGVLEKGDIQDFIQCNLLVWRGHRGILPAELIEDEINRSKTPIEKLTSKIPSKIRKESIS